MLAAKAVSRRTRQSEKSTSRQSLQLPFQIDQNQNMA
jgi:hypothetical protein